MQVFVFESRCGERIGFFSITFNDEDGYFFFVAAVNLLLALLRFFYRLYFLGIVFNILFEPLRLHEKLYLFLVVFYILLAPLRLPKKPNFVIAIVHVLHLSLRNAFGKMDFVFLVLVCHP